MMSSFRFRSPGRPESGIRAAQPTGVFYARYPAASNTGYIRSPKAPK